MSSYEIKYRHSDYTFLTEAKVERLTFDEGYMHMADGRVMSITLGWIPTLYHALPADREHYYLTHDGHAAHWCPKGSQDEAEINEDLWLPSFLRYDETK